MGKMLKANLIALIMLAPDWLCPQINPVKPHCYLHRSWEVAQGRGFLKEPILTDIKLGWLMIPCVH